MAQDKFLIGPYKTGLQRDKKPWLTPTDSFERLRNAYVWRDRIRKRWGSFLLNQSVSSDVAHLYSRLRSLPESPATQSTNGSGNISSTAPGSVFEPGQMLSIGNTVFTVHQAGTPASMLRSDGSGATATFNTTTGAFTINGADPNTDVYFYPALPVMGLKTREVDAINQEELIAFDRQFAYKRNSSTNAWERITGVSFSEGDDVDFFWSANWIGQTVDEKQFFVTNFAFDTGTNTYDEIKAYDGSTWTNLTPVAYDGAGNLIATARIIIPFKNRLLLFNVVENISGTLTHFPSRLRYSQNGNPFQADAWRQDTPGKGGFLDAPTTQAIITVEDLHDRLIVYFERSTFELVATGSPTQPFVWRDISSDIGAESTFSIVNFDKVAIGMGETGIYACDGASVKRIDQKIPDDVFRLRNIRSNTSLLNTVQGVRDYYTEMVYWTFHTKSNDRIFPDQLLVYNYDNDTWAFFDDTITTFGYFQTDNAYNLSRPQPDTWAESLDPKANPQNLSNFRHTIAGDQQGFTFLIDRDGVRNAPSMYLSQVSSIGGGQIRLTIYNHVLEVGDFIAVEGATGISGLNSRIYKVQNIVNEDQVDVDNTTFSGSYTGNGVVTRVSKIDIFTHEFQFYLKQAQDTYLDRIYFNVTRTDNGEITIDYNADTGTESLVPASQTSGSILGTNILEMTPLSLHPEESNQARLWHPVYFQAEAPFVQLRFYWTDEQMVDTDIAWDDMQMHAMLFYVSPTGKTL